MDASPTIGKRTLDPGSLCGAKRQRGRTEHAGRYGSGASALCLFPQIGTDMWPKRATLARIIKVPPEAGQAVRRDTREDF